jgi:hypothetical protein
MNNDDELDNLLRELAVSQPQFGRQLPTWLLIQSAPPPEAGTVEPISLSRDTIRWHPPGSDGISKAAAGGVKGADDFRLGVHGELSVRARWWENRFVIKWRAVQLDPRTQLFLTFLNPITDVPIAPEIDAGCLSEKEADIDDCAALGFSPTRNAWTLQIRIVEPLRK